MLSALVLPLFVSQRFESCQICLGLRSGRLVPTGGALKRRERTAVEETFREMGIREEEILALEFTTDAVKELKILVVGGELGVGLAVIMLRSIAAINISACTTLTPHTMARLSHPHDALDPLHVPHDNRLTWNTFAVVKHKLPHTALRALNDRIVSSKFSRRGSA